VGRGGVNFWCGEHGEGCDHIDCAQEGKKSDMETHDWQVLLVLDVARGSVIEWF
jgi:hypothetical protein